MNQDDRKKIDILLSCEELLSVIDLKILWPKLLENKIFNRDDVNVPNWQKNLSDDETKKSVITTIKTRGPNAFKNFLSTLRQVNYLPIVNKLSEGDAASTTQNNCENNNLCNNEEKHNDDYYKKIVTEYEKLTIKVKKSERFLDTPDKEHIPSYPMRSNPRGLVLVITNIIFENMDSRLSARHDKENLNTLFKDMGFKVLNYENLTGDQIRDNVQNFSQMKELRHVDCAFIIISTHGYGVCGKQQTEIRGCDWDVYDANYTPVYCSDIIEYFNAEKCRHLRGKPKIFIFQACRGEKHQKAVSRTEVDAQSTAEAHSKKTTECVLTTRNYEDTLLVYATLPGYYSYRDKHNGSWFIQILCEVFMNHACERHVEDLLKMTDSRMQDLRTAKEYCQTLWIVNQGFNKHCYLNPGLF